MIQTTFEEQKYSRRKAVRPYSMLEEIIQTVETYLNQLDLLFKENEFKHEDLLICLAKRFQMLGDKLQQLIFLIKQIEGDFDAKRNAYAFLRHYNDAYFWILLADDVPQFEAHFQLGEKDN